MSQDQPIDINKALENLRSDPTAVELPALLSVADTFKSVDLDAMPKEQAKEILQLCHVLQNLHPFIRAGLRNYVSESVFNRVYESASRKLGINISIDLDGAQSVGPLAQETAAPDSYKTGSLAEPLRASQVQKLEALERENSALKILLSKKYSAQTLLVCSGGFLLAFLGAIVAHYSFNITLIHPALAFVGVLASVGFAALSLWRLKCK